MTAPAACLLSCVVAAWTLAGCASFPDSPADFSVQPQLTPNVASVVPPTPVAATGTTSSEGGTPTRPDSGGQATTRTPGGTPDTARTTGTTAPTEPPAGGTEAPDPCAPPALPVVAVCLDDPWGLAPLPDGQSALVGERTSGRILAVAAGQQPRLVTTIAGVDASRGGGLLGITLSPYYVEDSLVYAYVTTATDARIVRIAPKGEPKVIVSGLPAGGAHPGGAIAFGSDGLLYVATGSADGDGLGGAGSSGGKSGGGGSGGGGSNGGSGAAGSAEALSVLRFDTFGKPAGAGARATTSTPGAPGDAKTAVVATGFVDPTGICPIPGGRIAVVDHRGTGDALILVRDGANYRTLADGDTLWTFGVGDGGASDCAVSDGALLATGRTTQRVTRIQMRPGGGFSGEPEALLDREYGLLRTVVTGPGEQAWLTTANRPAGIGYDGAARDPGPTPPRTPGPSDDRVIVLPPGGGGGDGGVD